jgi:hypothetical protein
LFGYKARSHLLHVHIAIFHAAQISIFSTWGLWRFSEYIEFKVLVLVLVPDIAIRSKVREKLK